MCRLLSVGVSPCHFLFAKDLISTKKHNLRVNLNENRMYAILFPHRTCVCLENRTLSLSLFIYLFVCSLVRSFFFSFRIKEIERIKSVGGIVYQSFLKEKKKTSTQSKQNELFLDIVHVNCLFAKRNSRENSQ